MQKILNSAFIAAFCFCNLLLSANEFFSNLTEKLPIPPGRLELSHIESKGVGYKHGYTSLKTFATLPQALCSSWTPFVDLRGHIFNDSKLAANAGIGLRYLTSSRVWGINTYYDYRHTHHNHYNQLGFGLESLGCKWDFRINGYMQLDKAKRTYFERSLSYFSLIHEHKIEFALKGIDGEVGMHGTFKDIDFYVAAGPYFFQRKSKKAYGAEGRIVLMPFQFLNIEVIGSCDSLYHGILQAAVSLVIPFGMPEDDELHFGCDDCSDYNFDVRNRMFQRVDRREIIVVDKKQRKEYFSFF